MVGPTNTTLSYALAYNCSCSGVYSGDNCAHQFTACDSSPCQNGGECSNWGAWGKYACSCTSDYRDNNCETFEVCSSAPCQHNGTCTSFQENIGQGRWEYACGCVDGVRSPPAFTYVSPLHCILGAGLFLVLGFQTVRVLCAKHTQRGFRSSTSKVNDSRVVASPSALKTFTGETVSEHISS